MFQVVGRIRHTFRGVREGVSIDLTLLDGQLRLRLEPALDLGLELRADGFVAYEPERAKRLLTRPVRDALALESLVALSDHHVVLRVPSRSPDLPTAFEVQPVAERAMTIALAIDRARRDVPCAARLRALEEAWRASATTAALGLIPTPLTLAGVYAGYALEAQASLDPTRDGYSVRVRLGLPQELPFRIHAERDTATFWESIWGTDYKTGVEPFDAMFRVRGDGALAAETCFDARACALALGLEQRFGGWVVTERFTQVVLKDERLAGDIPAVADRLVELAQVLELNTGVRRERRGHAYR